MTAADLPSSLAANPRLARWLRFDAAGFVDLYPGRVELGQGVSTAFAQIAADELGLGVDRIRVREVDSRHSPDEGWTNGSKSVELGGSAVRQACAEARALFLAAARSTLETTDVELQDGEFVGPHGRTTYWRLAERVSLDCDATGTARPQPIERHAACGQPVPRRDLVDKVRGRGGYVHNLVLAGMLHARVIRPASLYGRLLSFAPPTLPGVTTIRDGSFVAVISESEARAVAAMAPVAAAARWAAGEPLPDTDRLLSDLLSADSATERHAGTGSAIQDQPTIRSRYSRQFVAHASLGPSCAVAQWDGSRLHVRCATQGVYVLRKELARAFGTAVDDVTVEHLEGSGCYGHNGADDAAYEAALIARHTGRRPVRLQWTRADEFSRAPYGPAGVVEIAASLDHAGHLAAWDTQLWTYGARGRPGYSPVGPAFWAASQLAEPFARDHAHLGGAARNGHPEYVVPARSFVSHLMMDQAIRTSSLRSLGAHLNVFAIESAMDELAAAAGADPVTFRLRHLADPRSRCVIEAAADAAGWPGRSSTEGYGLGIGYARYHGSRGYCAVVAEVEVVNRLRVVRLTAAVDVGFVVNPDGLENQVAGGAIQATSWTTLEQVRFSRDRILSDSWGTYPILRFSDVPDVRVVTVARPDEPAQGAGEIMIGPTAAAIGNAVAAALGVRVRDLPLTQDRIVAAVNNAPG